MEVDTSRWSGEGEFTQLLLDRLKLVQELALIRVEDAPASRAEAAYNFVSNEIFVAFSRVERWQSIRRLGFWPGSRKVVAKAMSLSGLEATLTEIPEIGAPDYADEGMLQYLRTERIVPPYQTRGYKLVEMVRLYEVGDSR
jgi:hypothetical protein